MMSLPLASRKTLRSFSRSSDVAFTRTPNAPEKELISTKNDIN